MEHDFLFRENPYLVVLALAAALALAAEAGYRYGCAARAKLSEQALGNAGRASSALFALLGLLLAFTFSAADTHHDRRTDLVPEQASAIEIAYERAGFLAEAERTAVEDLLRQYLAAQLAPVREDSSPAGHDAAVLRSDAIERKLWSHALAAAQRDPQGFGAELFASALNDLTRVGRTHAEATRKHVPEAVLWLLFAVAITAIGAAGYAGGVVQHRGPFSVYGLGLMIALVILVIIDLDGPHDGLLRPNASPLAELEHRLGAAAPTP